MQPCSDHTPPRTVRRLRDDAASRIGGDAARLDAECLLAHALARPRAWLFAHPEFEADAATATRFDALVVARCGGAPIAYLLGRREFFGFDLQVSPAVLIPRADTELLVELALVRIPPDARCTVADLGTGSGAIALAIGRERPHARVLATDASAAALAVARGNAERLAVANVEFALGDWCAALGARRFDLIVSNPPYIADADAHLAAGDLRFEPRSALASGSDGLDAIRDIVGGVHRHLRDGAWLLLEHGFDQGEAVRALMATAGLASIETALDIEKRERVTSSRRR